ncbi:hypothetical protein ACF068_06555 [Streptomyces sp. NPDC016309]|uniref:hypothetical protein n=1 Tax=Streptomyces sp. NPDC016309 TaxID=3364965 RepID=UPI0036F843F5
MSATPQHFAPRPGAGPRRRRAVPAALLALALTAGTACAAPSAAAPAAGGDRPAPAAGSTGPERHDDLARLARELVDAGAPGVVVRVTGGRGRPVEIVRQAPWAARLQRLAIFDEFRMGCNTKTMMATLVLGLAAETVCR